MNTNTAPGNRLTPLPQRTQGLNLFLTGFLALFLELASIRWFAANVIFLHYFTNVVLLASFLGMSCGCMAARQRFEWLEHFPTLALVAACAAIGTSSIFTVWGDLASPPETFFGTQNLYVDVAQFIVPIDLIVAIFFVLIALLFVGLGHVMGKAFDAYPDRVIGYTLNIGGSLIGIILFSLLSFVRAPPAVWFLIIGTGIAYLLHQVGGLTIGRGLTLLALLVEVTAPAAAKWAFVGVETFWSPYYAVEYAPSLSIFVDNIGHQQM